MSSLLWAVVMLPAAIGAVLALVGHRLDKAAAPAAVVTAAAGLVLAVTAAVLHPSAGAPLVVAGGLDLAVDPLGALMLVTTASAVLLVVIFAAGDIHEHRARFFGLLLIFSAAAATTATATALPGLLLAWELMGACSFALIGYPWRQARTVGSGTTAFLVTRTGDLGLYLAVAAAVAGAPGLALADLPVAHEPWRSVAAAGVLAAAIGKSAQLPVSFWLSRAMDGPSPVSALLHSATMVALGTFLLLRTTDLLAATSWASATAAWVGVVTAVVLGAVALAQRDLKQLLAASTASQLGYVVLAAGIGSVSGGAVQLVAHAATKALLFLAAGAWLSLLGTRQLSALRGAGRRWPVIGVCAAVGLASLAGLPPLSLWAAKDGVLAAAREVSPALYLAGLLGAALAAAYAAKALAVLLGPEPQITTSPRTREEEDRTGPGDHGSATAHWTPHAGGVGGLQRVPLVVLAAAAAVLGALALPPVAQRLRGALDRAGAPPATPSVGELVLSGVVALVVVAVVIAAQLRRSSPTTSSVPSSSSSSSYSSAAAGPTAEWRQSGLRTRLQDWLQGWLGLEAAAHALVVRPVVGLATVLARWDDRGLDRGVSAVAAAATSTARGAARFDDRRVDGAVRSVAAAARAAGRLARRSQSGQLHRYYAAAAVVLLLAAVLLALAPSA
ncbi:NADH-quinone oxidoreductase subunit L [Streptomyces sp. NP160]|nr:NADH-quinone oxidoreductase subunit L [Streptomyces sp. NP160]